jgi:hypothetical protein
MLLNIVFSCLVALVLSVSMGAAESIIDNFPTAFSPNNRIMGFILAYSFNHIDPLVLIFNEYVSMCEGGWDPTIVIFTTSNWTATMQRYMRQRTYCYRLGRSINIRLDVHDRSIGTSLAAEHKRILREELEHFDFFVYHEDDIVFKYSHLVGYLNETLKLHQLEPETGLRDYVIGFQRYRRIMCGNAEYGENDIFEQDLFEEMPEFTPICIKDTPYLHVTGNTHQAIWAFATAQIRILQEKCHFIDHTSASR